MALRKYGFHRVPVFFQIPASREAGLRNSTRKKVLLGLILLLIMLALRMFGLLPDRTAVAY